MKQSLKEKRKQQDNRGKLKDFQNTTNEWENDGDEKEETHNDIYMIQHLHLTVSQEKEKTVKLLKWLKERYDDEAIR